MVEPAWSERLSTWLKECAEKHPLCIPISSSKLPKRVIDVLSRDDPFLLETNGEEGAYLALSYCWGKQRNLDMMTFGPGSKGKRGQPDPKPNIKAHSAGIDFSSMPKTLQDAVIVSRQLHFRFLWIDALCIVQGDDEEWQTEHPKLADLYANASFVIAADNAANLETGFLNKEFTMINTNEGNLSGSRKQAPIQRSPHSGTLKSSTRCPSPLDWDEPLNHRAWSLSEAIFANRIAHFTSSELIWECNEARQCDSGCYQAFRDDDADSFRIFRNTTVAKSCTETELYRKWDMVVEHFTKRQINSHPDERYKDPLKLVALSRVARKFSQILKDVLLRDDDYLAGIWRNHLESSLLWTVERGLQENIAGEWRRSVISRAPTWSWAAIEGPVSLDRLVNFKPAITIEHVSVENRDDSDRFGQVLSGRLIVQGRTMHGLTVSHESQLSSNHYATVFRPASVEGHQFVCDVPLCETDISQEFSCLYLGQAELEAPIGRGTRTYWAFLLLRPIPGDNLLFERAGISSRSIPSNSISAFLDVTTYESITII